MILKFEDLQFDVLEKVAATRSSLVIYSPYVKIEVIEKILTVLPKERSVTLITRAIISDFAMGVSDLSALQLLLDKKHLVLVNNRIHLKTYLYDFESLHTGSANCTNKGLGFASNSNFETLAYTESVEDDYLQYLDSISGTSKLVSQDDLNQLEIKIEKLKLEKAQLQDLEDINQNAIKDLFKMGQFLASHLPYSASVKELFEFIQGQKNLNADKHKHDVMVFRIEGMKFENMEAFISVLSERFFEQDFTTQLFNSFDDNINFGGVRRYFEINCIDNPRPNRDEVNVLINNVFNWLEEFNGHSYEIKQPSHTKIIHKKVST